MDEEACTGSDHYTLSGVMTRGPAGAAPAGRPYVPEREQERAFFRRLTRWGMDSVPREAGSPGELDGWAEALQNVITWVIQGAGRIRRQAGKGAPWWTPECKRAHAEMRAAARGESGPEARRAFEAAARKAKRDFWEERLTSATGNKDIYAITACHKNSDTFAPPPPHST